MESSAGPKPVGSKGMDANGAWLGFKGQDYRVVVRVMVRVRIDLGYGLGLGLGIQVELR